MALHVETFPKAPLPDGEYLELAEVETYLRELHRRYPARVLAPRRFSLQGREHQLPAAGPEVSYAGAFFEGSAQRLRAAGW